MSFENSFFATLILLLAVFVVVGVVTGLKLERLVLQEPSRPPPTVTPIQFTNPCGEVMLSTSGEVGPYPPLPPELPKNRFDLIDEGL